MIEFISQNLIYPKLAQEGGIEGKVYVEFEVRSDGLLKGFKIIKGIGFGCDEEALKVLKSMPNWKPGEHKKKKVNVEIILPINFELNK